MIPPSPNEPLSNIHLVVNSNHCPLGRAVIPASPPCQETRLIYLSRSAKYFNTPSLKRWGYKQKRRRGEITGDLLIFSHGLEFCFCFAFGFVFFLSPLGGNLGQRDRPPVSPVLRPTRLFSRAGIRGEACAPIPPPQKKIGPRTAQNEGKANQNPEGQKEHRVSVLVRFCILFARTDFFKKTKQDSVSGFAFIAVSFY